MSKVRQARFGAIAQLGERVLCKHDVVGSIPSGSTIRIRDEDLKVSPRANAPVIFYMTL